MQVAMKGLLRKTKASLSVSAAWGGRGNYGRTHLSVEQEEQLADLIVDCPL